MKNIDLEKLERKNSYKVPENFFGEMQENVLKCTIEKAQAKPAKIFKLNYAWAVAAAFALIFGLGFFITKNNGGEKDLAKSGNVLQTNTTNTTENIAPNTAETAKTTDAEITYHAIKQEIAAVEKSENKGKVVAKKVSAKTLPESQKVSNSEIDMSDSQVKVTITDAEVENLLASFSNDDLKQMSKNSDQDIYLDLYN